MGGINKNHQAQTRYLQSAAYVRCKNIQFGYTLPQTLVSKAGISNCRIYLSCDNLFTITGLSSVYDPEAFEATTTTEQVVRLIRCSAPSQSV